MTLVLHGEEIEYIFILLCKINLEIIAAALLQGRDRGCGGRRDHLESSEKSKESTKGSGDVVAGREVV